jgi:hypothetical protein
MHPRGTSRVLLHAKNLTTWDPSAFFLPEKKAGFEPATFGTSCKHTNNYTTEETVEVSGETLLLLTPKNTYPDAS